MQISHKWEKLFGQQNNDQINIITETLMMSSYNNLIHNFSRIYHYFHLVQIYLYFLCFLIH